MYYEKVDMFAKMMATLTLVLVFAKIHFTIMRYRKLNKIIWQKMKKSKNYIENEIARLTGKFLSHIK